jgi:hypothetical protein
LSFKKVKLHSFIFNDVFRLILILVLKQVTNRGKAFAKGKPSYFNKYINDCVMKPLEGIEETPGYENMFGFFLHDYFVFVPKS